MPELASKPDLGIGLVVRRVWTHLRNPVANTGYRRLLAAPEVGGFAIDAAKLEADAQFVWPITLTLEAPVVVLPYRNFLPVQQSFLAGKTLLAARPIVHCSDDDLPDLSTVDVKQDGGCPPPRPPCIDPI